MPSLPEMLGLSTLMGLALFVSLPIVLRKEVGSRTVTLLNASAIGILLFLLADVFADIAGIIYPSGTTGGYVADPTYAAIFIGAAAGCFLILFGTEERGRAGPADPRRTAAVVALAIGFQNLTEGLVFGANWASGAVGLVGVIFLGFFLQNVTEGFPITAPLVGTSRPSFGPIVGLFLLAGVPTVLGSAIGYFDASQTLELLFDSLAVGAVLYCLLPMLRVAFRPADTPEASRLRQRLLYVGVLLGFVVGFAVNSI